MAKNLTIDQVEFIAIYKLCAYNHERWRLNESISHEVHLAHQTLGASIRAEFSLPDQEIGLLSLIGSGSAIDRPGMTRCLFFQDELYFVLTWTDIAGSGHGKQCGLRRTHKNHLVFFLQKVINQEHRRLILDLIADRITI